MSDLLLFDTNVLVHLVRDDSTGQQIRTRYRPFSSDPKPRYCVVCEGEIRSLALQFLWGGPKLNQMEFSLAHLGRLTIEKPEIMNAYAMFDAYSKGQGITMGKNDLWIAATAFDADARLVTTDDDFDHLTPNLIQVDKIEYP
ncbi:MAG: type II toxin-antitoxin system VapC family toxin [Blastocatellia bacterium]